MKIKTNDLKELALDYVVAMIEGYTLNPATRSSAWIAYSTDWAQGGPIIEREQLHVSPEFWIGDGWHWVAYVLGPGNLDENFEQRGPTPLIAAMRCYVASKLGDEVEIPEELT
jgi:hypothetical protein